MSRRGANTPTQQETPRSAPRRSYNGPQSMNKSARRVSKAPDLLTPTIANNRNDRANARVAATLQRGHSAASALTPSNVSQSTASSSPRLARRSHFVASSAALAPKVKDVVAKSTKQKSLRKLFDQFADPRTGLMARTDLLRIATAQLINKPYEVGSAQTPRTRKKLPITPGKSTRSPSLARKQTPSPTSTFTVPAAMKIRLEDPVFATMLWANVPKPLGLEDDEEEPPFVDFDRFYALVSDLYDENGIINESSSILRAEIRALILLAEGIENELDKERQHSEELEAGMDARVHQYRAMGEQLEQASSADVAAAEATISKLESEKHTDNLEISRLNQECRDLNFMIDQLEARTNKDTQDSVLRRKYDELVEAHRSLETDFSMVADNHEKAIEDRNKEIQQLLTENRNQAGYIEALQTEIKQAEASLAAMALDVAKERNANAELKQALSEEQDYKYDMNNRRRTSIYKGASPPATSLEDELRLAQLQSSPQRSPLERISLADELGQLNSPPSNKYRDQIKELEDLVEGLRLDLTSVRQNSERQASESDAKHIALLQEVEAYKGDLLAARESEMHYASELKEAQRLVELWRQQFENNKLLYEEQLRLKNAAASVVIPDTNDTNANENMVTVEVKKEIVKSRHSYSGKRVIDSSEEITELLTWFTAPGIGHINENEWSPAEDKLLSDHVSRMMSIEGHQQEPDWVQICRVLPGRPDKHCAKRWRVLSGHGSSISPIVMEERGLRQLSRTSSFSEKEESRSQALYRLLNLSTTPIGSNSDKAFIV